jgi:hypothetical protein|tara:strand:+ start:13932 stop:14633 length:702 start_codon:yes stop_codon:yes gene_type:complete
MGLPKIDKPIFEITLPSTGKIVQATAFSVKEEKILLVAQESNDATQEVVAVKQIVNNCLVDMDVSELAMFDLEYVLLVLRSRSVNNEINFVIKDPATQEDVELSLDIESITVTKDPNHTNEIKVNEDFTLFLKYPTIDQYIKIVSMEEQDPLINYQLMVNCLDQIASEDEVHKFINYTADEINAFVENFSGSTVKGIQDFFETMPKLRHEMKYINSAGDSKTFVVEGIRSFFI